jgi:hypothetical protein
MPTGSAAQALAAHPDVAEQAYDEQHGQDEVKSHSITPCAKGRYVSIVSGNSLQSSLAVGRVLAERCGGLLLGH